ncbi:MAG: DUF695 domain-containing protein [Dokdonella sp.]
MKKFIAMALLFCPSANVAADLPGNEAKWWVGTGERNGRPVIVRALGELPAPAERAAHSWVAKISWIYTRLPDGKLSRDDAARAFEFENMLAARMEESGLALEAVSVTIDDTCEWTYYASDKKRIIDLFEAVKRKFPGAPASIEIHRDRQWSELKNVLEASGK